MQPLVRERLRNLLALCDYSGLHMPIRQILLLLVNAVLGHSGRQGRSLMTCRRRTRRNHGRDSSQRRASTTTSSAGT